MSFRFSELRHIRYSEGSRSLSLVMGSKFYSVNVPPNFPLETDAESVLRALDRMLAEADRGVDAQEREKMGLIEAALDAVETLQGAMP